MADKFSRKVYPPPIFQGLDWHMEVGFRKTSGDAGPFDWTEEPTRFDLRSDITDKTGKLLARFTKAGIDGTVIGNNLGILAWDLPGSATELLPLTRDFRNVTDPRITTYRSRAVLFLDLIVTDNTTSEQWTMFQTQVPVSAPVTVVP